MSETKRPWKWLRIGLQIPVWAYLACLFGWAALRALFGDGWWWLFLANTFAPYYFLPLVLVLVAALLVRRRAIWIGFFAGLGLWMTLYGGLFTPSLRLRHANNPSLSVMSYNLSGFNTNMEGVVASTQASQVDVAVLQELNAQMAEAIEYQLVGSFPYQLLESRGGPDGMGIISRYPFIPRRETLPGVWVGAPQMVVVDVEGTPVTVLNLHTFASNTPGVLVWTIEGREQQAQAIADFAAARSEPLVVATDFNATDQNDAYRIVTDQLSDSWREAGWGFGHTFPGFVPYPEVFGIPYPRWLWRIDYVFHSDHWQAESAHIGPWDGLSDHRPVVVTLRLRDTDPQSTRQ